MERLLSITNSLVTFVTNISFDFNNYLGCDLSSGNDSDRNWKNGLQKNYLLPYLSTGKNQWSSLHELFSYNAFSNYCINVNLFANVFSAPIYLDWLILPSHTTETLHICWIIKWQTWIDWLYYHLEMIFRWPGLSEATHSPWAEK